MSFTAVASAIAAIVSGGVQIGEAKKQERRIKKAGVQAGGIAEAGRRRSIAQEARTERKVKAATEEERRRFNLTRKDAAKNRLFELKRTRMNDIISFMNNDRALKQNIANTRLGGIRGTARI